MSYSEFPNGSEWRKWDLHIHSPLSGLANEFPKKNGHPDWEPYLQKLESLGDIPVLGITDYFLIEGYTQLRQFKNEGRLANIKLLLPNIEFRLDNLVGGKRINFHVIFSDQISPHEIEEHFLSNLDIVLRGDPATQSDKRKLKRSALEELGNQLKSQHARFTQPAFEVGCMTAVVQIERVMELLTTNSILKNQYLTGLAEENLSLMSWDGQDHNVRKTLLQYSDFIFCANPNSIEWCLGKKHPAPHDFINEFGSLKPCIIGSDAHELAKVGIQPNGKYTWIKADPTFDGLKQIIYEPTDRVFIGSSPPDEKDEARVDIPRAAFAPCVKFYQVKSNRQRENTIILGTDPFTTALHFICFDHIRHAQKEYDVYDLSE